jgi:hypothetical protein
MWMKNIPIGWFISSNGIILLWIILFFTTLYNIVGAMGRLFPPEFDTIWG